MQHVKIPGPEHPISIEPESRLVRVTSGGRLIANSMKALVLREANYPDVYYIPRDDVSVELLQGSFHASYCPYKGDCLYFDIPAAGEKRKNAVFSYPKPYEAVKAIRGHLAFYPDRVDSIDFVEA